MYWKNRINSQTGSDNPWETNAIDDEKVQTAIKDISNTYLGLEERAKSVRWRRLPFYKSNNEWYQPLLYEIRLSFIDEYESFNSSSEECIYFVITVVRKNIENEKREFRIFHLDGTSSPIHDLNDLFGGIELDKADEYTDFFSAYVSGDEGPFCIVQEFEDLKWAHEDDEQIFESEYYRRLIQLSWPDLASPHEKKTSYFKTFKELKIKIRKIQDGKWGIQMSSLEEDIRNIKAIVQYGRSLFTAEFEVTKDGMIEMLKDTPIEPDYQPFEINSWSFEKSEYVKGLMALVSKGYDTSVNPVTSKLSMARIPAIPITSPDDYFPEEENHRKHHNVWLEKKTGLRNRSGGYEQGKIIEINKTFYGPIEIKGVKFFDDVILSNSEVYKDLIFENCRFLGEIDLTNIRIYGNLIFKDCEVYGIGKSQGKQTSSSTTIVKVDGSTIEGDVVFSKTKIKGSLSIKSSHIGGQARFRGIELSSLAVEKKHRPGFQKLSESEPPYQIVPRFKGNDNYTGGVGLDLRYSSFDRGLEFSAFVPGDAEWTMRMPESEKKAVPTTIGGHILMIGCRVNGQMIISGVVTASLNPELYSETSQWHGVDLSNSTISGGIATWRRGSDPMQVFAALPTFISGELNISNVNIEGDLDLRGIRIEGDLIASNLKASSNFYCKNLSQVEIDIYRSSFHDLLIRTKYGKAKWKISKFQLVQNKEEYRLSRTGRTHIGGSLDFSNARILGIVHIGGAFIQKKIVFDNMEAKSLFCNTFFDFITNPQSDYFTQDDNVNNGFLSYRNLCGSSIYLKKSPAPLKEPQISAFFRCEASSLSITNSLIRGSVDLSGLKLSFRSLETDSDDELKKSYDRNQEIQKRFEMYRMVAMNNLDKPVSEFPSSENRLQIENSDIRGNLHFSNRDMEMISITIIDKAKLFFSLEDEDKLEDKLEDHIPIEFRSLECDGSVRIINSKIDGEIEISGVVASGDIEIRDVNLTSDLVIASDPVELIHTKTPRPGQKIKRFTFARNVFIEMLRCDGDIYLSGIRTPGQLKGENLIVIGMVDLTNQKAIPEFNQPEMAQIAAIVAGSRGIDFSGSSIGFLRIGGQPGVPATEKWTLERTVVKRIDIRAPFPQKVDLRQTEFERLTVNGKDEYDKVIGFLKYIIFTTSEPFARIEKIFRNQGLRDPANEVYVSMMEKLTDELPVIKRIPYKIFYGWFTGYGIGRLRLTFAAFVLYLSTLCALTFNYQNFNDGKTMSFLEKALAAVQISVPLIKISDDVYLNLKSEPPLYFPGNIIPSFECKAKSFCLSDKIEWISLRTLASFLSLAGWIIWPVFLLILTGFLRREN